MTNLSKKFIDLLYKSVINYNCSENEKDATETRIIDYISVLFAGRKKLGNKISLLEDSLKGEENGYTVLGSTNTFSLENAAFLNGISAHVLELDDGHRFGMIHPGAPITSAVISYAIKHNIDYNLFLKSIIIGYEAAIRLAITIQPSHKIIGYHGSGTCGTVGAAIALSVIMELDQETMKNAFSIAIASSQGYLKMIDDESELKPFTIGKAAQNGVIAVKTALAGFKGPIDVLSGTRGFLEMSCKKYNVDKLFEKNKNFHIVNTYLKPHASCRHTHPAVDAILDIKKKYSVDDYKKIKKIIVNTYLLAVEGHDHKDIPNVSSAKMSIPYSVASALVLGHSNLSAYVDRNIFNSNIKEVINLTEVYSSDKLSAQFPEIRGAQVEVKMIDGENYTKLIELPLGEPENKISDQQFFTKVYELLTYSDMDKDDLTRLYECFIQKNLDSNLFKLLRKIIIKKGN